jgi:hypothetical protein
MDPRIFSVILLLMAGALPLRELSAKWADRPDRRAAVRALWGAYLLVAVGAVAALIVVSRQEGGGAPPPIAEPDRYAAAAPACAATPARA